MENEMFISTRMDDDQNLMRIVAARADGYYVIKRVMDFLIALFLIILLFPLMLLIALVIYVYSPGPILFVQERVGAMRQRKGLHTKWVRKDFHFYKFRTMKLDADPSIHRAYVKALIENNEKQMSAIQGREVTTRKLVNDPRVIAPGKFLRKYSLDELPQLFNVLCGDMSMVGPRPAIPYEMEFFKSYHLQRLEAQPGITGLQQITNRASASFDQQIQKDIEYIKNQSLWLDLLIMLKTPLAIISTRGAH